MGDGSGRVLVVGNFKVRYNAGMGWFEGGWLVCGCLRLVSYLTLGEEGRLVLWNLVST